MSIERAHTQSYAAGSGCLNLKRILGGSLEGTVCLPLKRLLSDAFNPTRDIPPVLATVIRVSVVGNSLTNSPNVDTLRMAASKPGFVRRNLEASAVVILRPSSCNLSTSASAWGCRACFLLLRSWHCLLWQTAWFLLIGSLLVRAGAVYSNESHPSRPS